MTEPGSAKSERKPEQEGQPANRVPTVASEDLFQGGGELQILHDGQVYRLRLTRNNKLILQK